MRTFGRQNNVVAHASVAQPLANHPLALVVSAGNPARVEFGRVEHVAAGLKIMVHELHRALTANGATKIVGSERKGRCAQVRFRDV